MAQGFTKGIPLDVDGTLSANSDNLAPSQKAVKTYVDARATGTNTGNETASTLGVTINASSAATPNDTDLVTTVDTSVVKKITWANVKAFLKTYFDTIYQTVLVSGTNIKTINGSSVLGSGNLVVTGSGSSWGSITGTLSSQTDLQSALDGKLDENVAITGATKTKITYDAKGLVTAGDDATTADISDSLNKRYVTDAQLTVIGNTSGTNTGDETTATIQTKLGTASTSTSGYLTSTDWNTFNNKQPAGTYATGTGTATGTNTGDQTSIVGISGTKAQFDTACSDGNFIYVGDIGDAAADGATKGIATFETNDFNSTSGKIGIDYTNGQAASGSTKGFLTAADWTTFNNKQAALTNPVTGTGTNNEIAAFNSTGSTITSLTTATYPSLTELSYVKGLTSDVQAQLNGKEPTITNGFGITGTTTKAVALTSSAAFATATTTISAATYADITGCSVTLAAGTWIIFAHIVGGQPNAIIQMFGAITDAANTVIAESAQSRPASGTASLNSPMSMNFQAIVSPSVSTTYKLRAARGLTTHTGSFVVYDGSGYNTTNHATNNSDKGTSIIAIRIA